MAVISDIGPHGALYLRVHIFLPEASFHPEGRWAIIPTKSRKMLKNVRSVIARLPKSDNCCHHLGRHRLVGLIPTADNHPSNSWSTLAILLPVDHSHYRYRDSVYLVATSSIWRKSTCSLLDPATPGIVGGTVRCDLYLVTNQPQLNYSVGSPSGNRPGRN